jgi:hypothetical protein
VVIISSNKHGIGFYGLIIPWSAWAGAISGIAAVSAVKSQMGGTTNNAELWTGTLIGGTAGYVAWAWIKS